MEKSIKLNNCTISYDLIQNIDKPAVVLIHGFGVNRKMWQPQIDFLSDKYAVINIDIRGHGQSRPCDSFSVKEAASDLRNILLAEKCENAVLIGLSMGGYIIQEYAFSYGGASGYMIIGSVPIFLPCYSKWEKTLLNYSAGIMKLYPWRYMKNQMAKISSNTEEARKLLVKLFDEMTQNEFVTTWKELVTCIHEEHMQFDAPLLVTCGEDDKTGTVKKCMKFWNSSYKRCETKIFEKAGHAANLDTVQDFNEKMISFIRICTG